MSYLLDVEFKELMEKILPAATEKWWANNNKETNHMQRLWKDQPVTGGDAVSQMGRENFFKYICIGLASLDVTKAKMLLLFIENMIWLSHFFLLGDHREVWKHPSWLPEPRQGLLICNLTAFGREPLESILLHFHRRRKQLYHCSCMLHPQPAAAERLRSECLQGSSAYVSLHMTLQAHRKIKIQVYCNLYAATSSTSRLSPRLSPCWE